MGKQLLILVLLGCGITSYGQTFSSTLLQKNKPASSLKQLIFNDSLKQAFFLEIDARIIPLDIDQQSNFKVQRSIMKYDLEAPPETPFISLSDRNNFAAAYQQSNLAYFEALKNTTYSQLYNPFSLHKQL